jgi:hypothetical protein
MGNVARTGRAPARGTVTRAPDFVEPVVGWRMWYALEDSDTRHLSSIVHKTAWPQRAPLVAACRKIRFSFRPRKRRRHDAPAEDCTCGIYAAGVWMLRAYLPAHISWLEHPPVLGQVSLWGTVCEHEHGWRATFAYPKRLYVPVAGIGARRASLILEDLRAYGVPVSPLESATVDDVLEELTTLTSV